MRLLFLILVFVVSVRSNCRPTDTCTYPLSYPCIPCEFEGVDNPVKFSLDFIYQTFELVFTRSKLSNISLDTFEDHLRRKIVAFVVNDAGIKDIWPGSFLNGTKLKNLYLQDNKITTLRYGAFEGLSGVERMNLSRNLISTIETGALDDLVSLKELDLSYNQLSKVEGGQFFHAPSFRNLQLHHNNISIFPEDIGTHLAVLDLSYNKLEKLHFVSNNWLRKLYLSHNLIRDVIWDELIVPKLVRIDLSNNLLTKVNLTFGTIDWIDLRYNQISYIEKGGLDLLYMFNSILLAGNNLSSINFNFLNSKIETSELDLSNNTILLSKEMFNETLNVKKLNLGMNSIATIPSMVFLHQEEITKLDLSRNLIEVLQLGSLSGLKSLYELDISENKITNLHSAIFVSTPKLSMLNLTGNFLQTLDAVSIAELTKLKQLDIQSNDFHCSDLSKLVSKLNKLNVHLTYGSDINGIQGISCNHFRSTNNNISPCQKVRRLLERVKVESSELEYCEAKDLIWVLLLLMVVSTIKGFLFFDDLKWRRNSRRYEATEMDEVPIMQN